MTKSRVAVLLTIGMAVASSAPADVIGVTGAVLVISPPPSVAQNVFESDTNIFLFSERSMVTLPFAIKPFVIAPGTYPPDPLNTTTTIPAGTLVDTFYVHADRVGVPQGPGNTLTGSVNFDADVLGIQLGGGDGLIAQSGTLGAPGTTYTNAGSWDPIVNCGPDDRVILSANRRTVTLCTTTYDSSDDLRIIVKGRVLVDVDIKPGSYPNAINRDNNGVIPVAILGSSSLDVTQIDVASLVFAGGTPAHTALEDVNGDSVLDLIMQVPTGSINLSSTATQACVLGSFLDSTPFKGCDSVKIVR